ncbi:MAG: SGNH/GDSL hydrolase family protein [Opitutaceae bacterium]|nr:SGNH/GDSL hydrolase family protein [Opitutaceae bacterium]
MQKLPRVLVCLVVALGALGALAQTPPAKKAKAVNPAYAPVTDVAGLPRVLLIGDSISIGYTVPVRERLAGRANVHRPPENCGDSARGVGSIDKWLGTGKWDVIHFNFGLHDLKYLDEKNALAPPNLGRQVASPEVYEKNLRAIVARLKKTGAKLIFATTTPVPAGSAGRLEADVPRYNAVAARVMKEMGVMIDDLYAFVVPRQTQIQRPQNVHFTDAGSAQLADAVVASITPVLPRVK